MAERRDDDDGARERDPVTADEQDAMQTGRDEIRRDDETADEASEDSFPASDPPSYTGATAGMRREDERRKRDERRDDEERT